VLFSTSAWHWREEVPRPLESSHWNRAGNYKDIKTHSIKIQESEWLRMHSEYWLLMTNPIFANYST
jgi:hypothetical protein